MFSVFFRKCETTNTVEAVAFARDLNSQVLAAATARLRTFVVHQLLKEVILGFYMLQMMEGNLIFRMLSLALLVISQALRNLNLL